MGAPVSERRCELGRLVPEPDGSEAIEFNGEDGMPTTVRCGRRSVTMLPRYGGPIRLTADQARALATVLQRWVVRRTFAAGEESHGG